MFYETIILGGGIAGAVCSYYQKDNYALISDNLGGQLASSFDLGPRYLHVNEYNEALLKDLDMSLNTKAIKVGYYIGGSFADEISDEMKMQYYVKSRGLNEERIHLPKSALSSGKNSFDIYEVGMQEVCHRMLNSDKVKDKIVKDKILSIDTKNKVLFAKDAYYEYDKLISTIPYDVFYSLACPEDGPRKVFSPITYCFLPVIADLNGKNYVYFPQSDCRFHRVTVIDKYKDKGLVFDFQGVLTKAQALFYIKQFRGLNYSDLTVRRQLEDFYSETSEGAIVATNTRAQIIGSVDYYFDDVDFVGRFAQLSHSIKTEDIVKYARHLA